MVQLRGHWTDILITKSVRNKFKRTRVVNFNYFRSFPTQNK